MAKKDVDREWKTLQNFLSMKPAIDDIEKSLNQYLTFLLSSIMLNLLVKDKKDSEFIINYWMNSFKKNYEAKIEKELSESKDSEFTELKDIKSLYYLALNCVVDEGKQAMMKLIVDSTDEVNNLDQYFNSNLKEKSSPLQ